MCFHICRERPTSPSTEEAIQGMLSMAGLLYPQRPGEDGNSQEPWWSSPTRLSPGHRGLQAPSVAEGKGFMDSQGNSSSEAWDHHELPPSPLQEDSPSRDFQYRESSMSPPLHPSKRHASNPPPISNQATKGMRLVWFFSCLWLCSPFMQMQHCFFLQNSQRLQKDKTCMLAEWFLVQDVRHSTAKYGKVMEWRDCKACNYDILI